MYIHTSSGFVRGEKGTKVTTFTIFWVKLPEQILSDIGWRERSFFNSVAWVQAKKLIYN